MIIQNRAESRVCRPHASAHAQHYRAHRHCAGARCIQARNMVTVSGFFIRIATNFAERLRLPTPTHPFPVHRHLRRAVRRDKSQGYAISYKCNNVTHITFSVMEVFSLRQKRPASKHAIYNSVFCVLYQTPSLSLLYHVHSLAYLCPRP